MSSNALVLALCALLAALPGCAYKYQFRTDLAPTGIRVERTHHIRVWGHYSSEPFNLEEACPTGVSEFGSYISFLNWLPALLTLGVYSPRTVYAICGEAAGANP